MLIDHVWMTGEGASALHHTGGTMRIVVLGGGFGGTEWNKKAEGPR